MAALEFPGVGRNGETFAITCYAIHVLQALQGDAFCRQVLESERAHLAEAVEELNNAVLRAALLKETSPPSLWERATKGLPLSSNK